MVWKRLVLLVLCTVASAPAWAWTQTGMLGSVRYSVYAPDWTWQKQNVNLLFVFKNEGADPVGVQARLEFPKEQASHFNVAEQSGQKIESSGELPDALSLDTTVAPGEEVRRAFTNIYARDGVPRQSYDFVVDLRAGDQEVRRPYALKTIRGAAVGRAKMAIYIPVVVAGIWSILFVFILKRYAAPGAWLVSGRSIGLTDKPLEQEAE